MSSIIETATEKKLDEILRKRLAFLPEDLFDTRFLHEKLFFLHRAYSLLVKSNIAINDNMLEVMTYKISINFLPEFTHLSEEEYIGTFKNYYQIYDSILQEYGTANIILDIGCGTGTLFEYFSKHAKSNIKKAKLIGIDNDEICIAIAKSYIYTENITFVCTDYKNYINELYEKVDLVLMNNVYKYYHDADLTNILQIKKVISDRGAIIVYDNNRIINDIYQSLNDSEHLKLIHMDSYSSFLIIK